jgi:hypothetical protein
MFSSSMAVVGVVVMHTSIPRGYGRPLGYYYREV